MSANWRQLASLAWLITAAALSLGAPLLSARSPFVPALPPLAPPQGGALAGADELGRDLLARLLYGGRFTLGASFLATLIAVATGTLLSALMALSARLDRWLMMLTNAALAIPGLLFALLLVALSGLGFGTVVLAVGFGGVPGFIRMARLIFQRIRKETYVLAAITAGARWPRVARSHLIPNAAAELLPIAALFFAWSLMGLTTLTFLGLAGDPSLPEWGAMLNEGRAYLAEAPRLALLPGAAISLTILSVHNLGSWLGGRRP